MLSRYNRRVSEGLCGVCGKRSPAKGKTGCSDCLERRRQRKVELKRKSLCIECRNPMTGTKGSLCLKCKKRKIELRAERLKAGLCDKCPNPSMVGKRFCPSCNIKNNARTGAHSKKIRQKVILLYGGKCVCCGLADIRFLTIDHVNGGGRKEHLSYKGGPTTFYRSLLDSAIRDDLQILCANCNLGRAWNKGVCPHQEDRIAMAEKEVKAI